MILFVLKGLLRDPARSVFPILMVAISVALVALGHAYLEGALGDIVEVNARFEAGHVKVITRAYLQENGLNPNELALVGVKKLMSKLEDNYKDYSWHSRIKFGGLLDIPDENGESLHQGAVLGIAADIFNPDSAELTNLNLKKSLVKGRLPEALGEILLSDRFFETLGLTLGQTATLMSMGMDGGSAVSNFKIVGTVAFGVGALDRGAMIADVSDIQNALYMENAATEILGFRQNGYEKDAVLMTQQQFNDGYFDIKGEFTPHMITIRDQGGLGEYIDLGTYMSGLMAAIFVAIVTLVLWNSGLRNGLRRYSEFGLRLAVGEDARHIYASQLVEALLIGIVGSFLGTLLGLIPAFYLQEVGFDASGMINSTNSTIMFQDTIRAKITLTTYWIGLVPGILATVLGAMIAGIGIFRRDTAQLFKDLEL